MQLSSSTFVLGLILFFIGFVLVLIALLLRAQQPVRDPRNGQTRSKGIILLGPIPIVWGFGTRGRQIATALCLIVIVMWVILFLF
ncbi:MAG: DUF131 domain-containing protein [Candidatus Thorarchaeota archaeon]|nr:MAG: DUF131 domain-containing protein [Candidatus Thorarchaeota archaeon]